MKLVPRPLAALPATLLGLALALPAQAAPPMWKVSDEDSTMYLFGTVHLLKPETQWRTPALEEAFERSQEVWFEVDPKRLEDPVLMGRLMPLMMDMERPLSTRLPPELLARFQDVARSLGVEPTNLEPFKPAIASTFLTMAAIGRAGYDPNSGVDKVLRGQVKDGTGIREFETAEQQMRFFADLPDEVQVALLELSLEQIGDIGEMDRMVEGWATGDVDAMEDVYLEEMMRDHAHAYDVFVRARNVAWADDLAEEMKGAGSDFIAVGALHLVGPDGLPTLLEQRGFTVERVDALQGTSTSR